MRRTALKQNHIMIWAVGITGGLALFAIWSGVGLYHAPGPLGFGLAVLLGAGLAFTALLVARAEVRRRRQVRTVYVGDSHLFNCELGLVPLKDGVALQDALADAMEQLHYSFRVHDFPNDDQFCPRFVVHTQGYKASEPVGSKAGRRIDIEACSDAPRQECWFGEVAMMRGGGSAQFDSPERLQAILRPLHWAAR